MSLAVSLQVVSVEEAGASAEAANVQAIKDECEADLAEAIPALEAALKALDTLTKNDITEVKGMKSPPAGMKVLVGAEFWLVWTVLHIQQDI